MYNIYQKVNWVSIIYLLIGWAKIQSSIWKLFTFQILLWILAHLYYLFKPLACYMDLSNKKCQHNFN
jgi:hypothetical protein